MGSTWKKIEKWFYLDARPRMEIEMPDRYRSTKFRRIASRIRCCSTAELDAGYLRESFPVALESAAAM